MTTTPTPSGQRAIGVALAAVFGASAVIFLLVWWASPAPDTLGYELGKVCLQALGVVLLGSLAARATFLFQQRRTDQSEALRDRRLLDAAAQARQREEQREDWRREVDNRRDERKRHDEVLHSVLDRTITTYHAVKQIRRLIDAETEHGTHPISSEAYDRHLRNLMEHQLEFEGLKRTAPLIDEREPTLAGKIRLEGRFEKVERYLNKVIDEYQTHQARVASAGDQAISSLPRLAGLIDGAAFRAGASAEIDEIIFTLQRMLLEPLLLPSVDSPAERGGDAP